MTAAIEKQLERLVEEPLRPGDHRIRPKGCLLIIGGAEDRKNEKLILRRLAKLVGSQKLVIATPATESPREAFHTYEAVMRPLGVRHVHHLRVEDRSDASSVRSLSVLEGAAVVLFTGGDQLKITSLLGDSPTFSRIFEIFAEGGVIAGTSAGAAVMCETMMVDGESERSPRIGNSLQLAPGLGFARDVVIDQHFAERGRVGRLLSVVGRNPRILGIGIDEDTAVEMRPARDLRIIGTGGVTIIDGQTVTHSNAALEQRDRTMSIFGVTLHTLSQGDIFDMRTRKPTARPADDVDENGGGRGGRGGAGSGRSAED